MSINGTSTTYGTLMIRRLRERHGIRMNKEIAVVGGGAAGMTAAISAARAGAHVTIYERNDRVGKKILSTGNGKCNFSNEKMSADCYYGSGAALAGELYKTVGVAEIKSFFEGLGMRIRDRNGYLYPASEQAATVLDILRFELERQAVKIHTGQQVTDLIRLSDGLSVETADGRRNRYDAVILAGGGKAAPKTGSDGAGLLLAEGLGHRIIPTVPALVALRCKEDFYKRVSGVRCQAGLTLRIDGQPVRVEHGELQWTDYGISGIPVFQFSREAAYALKERRKVNVDIHMMSAGEDNDSYEDYKDFWENRWAVQNWQSMDQFVTGLVNRKIGCLMLKMAGIRETDRAADVPKTCRRKLEGLFRSFTVEVKGTNSFDQAQVCAGGIDCAEVSRTLESKIVPRLFFAGEILDIDGICGGYNLQWAWSSGIAAGQAAADSTHASLISVCSRGRFSDDSSSFGCPVK